ncbi:biotin transporter BioY [Haloplanus aerogenes]|uniref:Biotin transport system substrate-specific component n=1 Tax=Haloplanus aerogenes TaxID=660522 RepID=A0A3M0CWM3_9EURY|nr:biotin transporter BioY [Haloplanus aerogenes]AZH23857.1 biotin transporter BioY [Haloplanus aerogenes]RMB13384.1 biotin transport system substrate-specific component [Haloplanus aerogenes]
MSTSTDSVELVGDEATSNVARAVLFAAATSATAPVDMVHPLAPNVPITLQTLWVYLAGIVLGPLWAGVAFTLYLLAGLIGLPVFAGGNAGLGVILGPTGGFLIGFPLAAMSIGAVAHGTDGLTPPSEIPVPRLVGALLAGTAVVYAAGAVGYSLVQAIGLVAAVSAVVVPFLPVAGLKVAATVAIVRSDALVAR